jgi:hypothetical protein
MMQNIHNIKYLQIVALSISLASESAGVSLSQIHIGVDVLTLVLLQIPLLSKILITPSTGKWFDSLMHPNMIQEVPRLLYYSSTAWVLTLVVNYVLLFFFIEVFYCAVPEVG